MGPIGAIWLLVVLVFVISFLIAAGAVLCLYLREAREPREVLEADLYDEELRK